MGVNNKGRRGACTSVRAGGEVAADVESHRLVSRFGSQRDSSLLPDPGDVLPDSLVCQQ